MSRRTRARGDSVLRLPSAQIAVFILACAIVTLIATAMMKDYTGADIDSEAR